MKIRLLILFLLFSSSQAFSQCTLAVNISSSETAICSGSTVILTANTSGGTGPFTYVWSTGETTQTIPVNKAGKYTVIVTDKTPGCSPVQASKDMAVSPVPDAPVAKGKTVCPNSTADLIATGPGGNYEWYDADGNFLKAGAAYTTLPITGLTTYYVQTTIGGCTSLRTAVNVNITGRPTIIPATVCAGSRATLMVSGGDSYAWFATPTSIDVITTADRLTTPILTATKSYYVEAVINGCTSPRTKITATVGAPPSPPVVVNPGGVCSGSVVTLHADVPQGIVDWYSTATGGTSLISSPDYTTQPLTANTTFYVQTTLNDCQSERIAVNITVNPIPAAPEPQTVTACYNSRVNLTASANPSGTYKWFDAPTGGHQVSADNVFLTPPVIRNTTYYVSVTQVDCGSARTPVNIIVNAPLLAPSVSPATICNGAVAILTPRSPAGSYSWFDVPTGGTSIFTGNSFTTLPLTASAVYYVQNTVAGCTSARTLVNVTVLPVIAVPTAEGATTCAGSSAILTATGSSGSYEWYDVATGGVPISDSRVFETGALTATKTYYVLATQNGCQSERKPVVVTINAIPPMPTAPAGPTICPGLIAHLTASPSSGGNISWYGSLAGDDLLSSTNSYDTQHLFATTTFYVQNNVGDCSSPRKAVTVTVNTSGTSFQYSSGTYSKSGGNPTPTVFNPSGGTFSASPAGLVFVSNNTGQINVGASAVGTYSVTLTAPGTCSGTYTTKVTITDNPLTGFTYGGPFCQGGNNPFPIFNNGASPGVFTAPAGLVFFNTTTGQINLNASTPGTYTVTNTIPASGAAPAVSSSASVTIVKKVVVDAGPDQRKQIGSLVNLAGTVSSGSVTWSGGGGTFSNPGSKNAVYTPATGETHVTLTLTSNSPTAPCGISSDEVDIYFFDTPPAPDAQGASICLGSNTTLSATAPGGIYKWYNTPTAGTLLETGPTFKIIGLTVTTTYYVQTTLNGVTSPRKAVTVTVNSASAAPTAQGGTVCSGSFTTLTATGGTGTYEWYDVPIGGQRLSIDATLLTPPLYANTTYYVQSVLGNCISARTPVNVLVKPVPTITSSFADPVCSGTALNYVITTDLPNPTFSWDRAAVAGISNIPVTGQTNAVIDETLINTGGTPIDVDYIITPTTDGCPGVPFDYKVTVNPTPTISGVTDVPAVCNGTASNYLIAFNTGSATSFTWGHATVDGISNGAVTGQRANTIREVLFNTTNSPIDVTYVIDSRTSTCQGAPVNLKVTVNPAINIISDPSNVACSGIPTIYTIKSNISEPNVTFKWERAAVNNISNPAAIGNSSTIDEPLINTGATLVNVIYIITPTAFGCTGNQFAYVVGVSPQPATPIANSNSPICVGNAIELATRPVLRGTYKWTGPDGFARTEQNPTIPNATPANAGTYNLYVTVGDCTSLAGSVDVVVNQLPHVDAGESGKKFCVTTTSIPLDGKITGSTTTGFWSSTGSPNTFELDRSVLVNVYHPSAQDIASGKVTLTLTSTSPDGCANTANRVILFGSSPGADAGEDIPVCNQETRVLLSGKILIPNGTGVWTSPTNGTFSPSANQTDNQSPIYYIPNAQDIANGSVTLTLHANNSGQCFDPTDDVVIKLIPPPTVDAGGIRYVLKDHSITLNPTVSDENVTYNWSPNINISSTTVKNPVITGDIDRTYTLTVIDSRGCISPVSQTFIRVSPVLDVPNTFTPNGDGFNDKWEIAGLVAYENCTVDIFNRYGTKLFHSKGYPTPWDGKYNGSLVPPGVYYYIIDTKVDGRVITGNVTIIR